MGFNDQLRKRQLYSSIVTGDNPSANHRPIARTTTFDCARCKLNRPNSTKRQVLTFEGRITCCSSCVRPGEKTK